MESERKISKVSKNTIRDKRDEILLEYANTTLKQGILLYVVGKSPFNESYMVFKFENNNETTEEIELEKWPQDACENDVLRFINNEYIVDKNATEIVKEKIMQITQEILDKQDEELREFRKEGHLYRVEEDRNEKIYLTDISDESSNVVLEEVEFPDKLLDKAKEGAIFVYQKGKYFLKNLI